MLAAVEFSDRVCLVWHSGRVRLHIEITTYCQKRFDAGDGGVVQVPNIVLQGKPVLSFSDFGGTGRRMLAACPDCMAALRAAQG